MSANPLLALKALGQHVWLDNLSRTLIREGALQRLINEDGIDGITSNPAIFQKALANSPHYRDDMARLHGSTLHAEARYEALVIPDIQAACDMLMPTYQVSRGETGYVSLEVSPALADDTEATVSAARRLKHAVARENLLIKVPGTPAGVHAFERLTAEGCRVNVTLLFSLNQYEAIAQAYMRGAQRWLDSGGEPGQPRSVASVFLSRVDTQVDKNLDALGSAQAAGLRGKAGVALAKTCYQRHQELFNGPAFAALAKAGVRPQTLLWASTGSKNPAYSDVLYVEPLIGPDTVTTLPEPTLTAFRDHGIAASTLTLGQADACTHLAALGIDMQAAGETLQVDGMRLFSEAYGEILAACGDTAKP